MDSNVTNSNPISLAAVIKSVRNIPIRAGSIFKFAKAVSTNYATMNLLNMPEAMNLEHR